MTAYSRVTSIEKGLVTVPIGLGSRVDHRGIAWTNANLASTSEVAREMWRKPALATRVPETWLCVVRLITP